MHDPLFAATTPRPSADPMGVPLRPLRVQVLAAALAAATTLTLFHALALHASSDPPQRCSAVAAKDATKLASKAAV